MPTEVGKKKQKRKVHGTSVLELPTVLRILIRSDPDHFGRIRVLVLINGPTFTFFAVCKSHKYLGISVS
jgi:hypothetical protein